MTDQDHSPQTNLVHAGMLRSDFGETNPAIYMSSGYVYDSAELAAAAFDEPGTRFVYSRVGNPNAAMLEARLAAYEGAEHCFATASGMAAVYAALMCTLKTGDRIVTPRTLFSSCFRILNDFIPRLGVEVDFIDGNDAPAWRAALSRPVTLVFLETPANPTLDIIDIAEVSRLTHAAGGKVIVDNVFATPVLQRPLQLGADVVVYSATKHMDGQGRCNGGAILCDTAFAEMLSPFVIHTGPMLSQFNAWVLFHGLETLELRVLRQSASADIIAHTLEHHEALESVGYPFLASHPGSEIARRQMSGGGGLITLTVKGGREGAFRFLDALRLVAISNNLGDSKSLITHPRTTTHARLSAEECARAGIGEGTVRLSIGLESAEDLLGDLKQALAVARHGA